MPEMNKEKVKKFQKSFLGQEEEGILDKVKRLLNAAEEDTVDSPDTTQKRKEKTKELLQKLQGKPPGIQPAPIEDDEEDLKRRLEEEMMRLGRQPGR